MTTLRTPRTVSRRTTWAVAGLVTSATAALVLSLSAWAADAPAGQGRPGDGQPPMGMHGEHGPGGEHVGHGEMDMFSGRHLERLLDDAKATDAQRTQIRQISEKARADLKTLHEQGRGLRDQALSLWTQPKLDAAAAEKLRQQMLAQHDQVSKRMTQAMLDVGNVLTAAQRVTVVERMKQQHEGMMARMKERMKAHMGMGRGEGASAPAPAHDHGTEK